MKERKDCTKFENIVFKRMREINRKNAATTKFEALMAIGTGFEVPKYLDEKIKGHQETYGGSYAEILASIASDPVTAAKFSKSASRQGVASKCQVTYLNERLVGAKVQILPTNNHESVRLTEDGEWFIGRKVKGVEAIKSIDSKRDLGNGGGTDWLFQKWTNEGGGGQDNQLADVKKNLRTAVAHLEIYPDTLDRFVALIDGPYYRKHREELDIYQRPGILIVTTGEYLAECNRPVVAVSTKKIDKKYLFVK